MTNFIVNFPTETEIFEHDILNTRYEIGRGIYNSLLNVTLNRYNEMLKTKRYRQALERYKTDKK